MRKRPASQNTLSSFFTQTEYGAVLANSTTGTQVLDPRKVRFTEVDITQVRMMVPQKCCALGHSLVIFVFVSQPDVVVKTIPLRNELKGAIALTGKVTEILAPHRGMVEVEIHLLQRQIKEWKSFLKSFEDRQELLNRCIRVIRS